MIDFPQNETFEHFLLKEIGKIYLRVNQTCNIVATEIRRGRYYADIAKRQFNINYNFPYYNKSYVDALGLKCDIYSDLQKSTIKSIEAKASIEDFRNGYCIGGEYNYIIAPKNVIPKDELPEFVGLIEVDFDSFSYKYDKLNKGVNSAKQAKKVKISNDRKEREIKKAQVQLMNRLTNKEFKNHWLKNVDLINKFGDKFNQGVMRKTHSN